MGLAAVAAGTIAVLLSQGADATRLPVDCTPVNPTMWTPTHPGINSQRAAAALGVTPDAIRNGSMGDAFCEDGVEPLLVEDARAIVKMQGGALCIAIGILSFEAPDYSKRYKDALVVCPGSDPASVAL